MRASFSVVIASLALLLHLSSAAELLQSINCTVGASLLPWQAVTGYAWECCDDCTDDSSLGVVIYPGVCSGPECETRNNPIRHELRQAVNVSAMRTDIQSGRLAFVFRGSVRTYCGLDSGQLGLSFVDTSGAVLKTTNSCRYQDTSWGSSVLVATPPVATVAVWVHLFSDARGGNDADGYFERLSLEACQVGGTNSMWYACCACEVRVLAHLC